MIFNSLSFVVFLFLFVIAYWFLPQKPRRLLIFVGSLIFYGFWRVDFIPLLLLSVVIDYVAARSIEGTPSLALRRLFLGVALVFNLLLLGIFKYLAFFVGVLGDLGLGSGSLSWNLVLPLGISFYTFQSMSYSVDVYRHQIKAEKNFLSFANYVLFFPQLVAGPILRAGEILPQLAERKKFHPLYLHYGLRRILKGLFLKVVLADSIAGLVDVAFSADPAYVSALDVWAMGILFGLQIYFDFSGYSHIAIGCASLLGIRFPENFRFPYLATSPKDFWQRWHISLSSWIRDYLYLPLCGVMAHSHSTGGIKIASSSVLQTQKSQVRRLLALVATWFLMGFWHGANWGFAWWGLWHAGLILLYRATSTVFSKPFFGGKLIGWALTQMAVMMGWIFFRSQVASDALVRLKTLFIPHQYLRIGLTDNLHLSALLLSVGVVVFGLFFQSRFLDSLRKTKLWPFMLFVGYGFVSGFVFVFFRPISQFIYFQF